MRASILTVLAIAGSFFVPCCVGQCPADTADAKNASTITVALSVYQGWIWADKVTEFCPTAIYKSRRRDFSKDGETLLAEIRAAMKGLPKFYVFALTTGPQSGASLDKEGKLTDEL